MNSLRLILRSWRHYRRVHAGVLLCAMLTTAVLLGALALGDSADYTLRQRALERLGQVQLAMDAGPRTVREQLAADIAASSGMHAVPALALPGVAKTPDDRASANDVRVLGVPPSFWQLADSAVPPLADGEVALNEPLARQLGSPRVGDMLVLILDKPSPLPIESPLADIKANRTSMLLKIRAVLGPQQLGSFALDASATPPMNAFVSLATMQSQLGLNARANLVLITGSADAQAAQLALRKAWTLDDAELEFWPLGNGELELRSRRIFLEDPVVRAARAASPEWSFGVFTYFVNELKANGRSCPYSMVSAIERPAMLAKLPPLHEAAGEFAPLGAQLAADGILINEWLANDLAAKPGDAMTMTYYVAGPGRKLGQASRSFRVAGVAPIEGLAGDRALMPSFPGLADAETCRNWQSDLVDMRRVRDKDEKYWDDFRGTPKAFVSPAAAREMWANPMGSLTAMRYAEGSAATIQRAILDGIDPAELGLRVQPVREQVLASAQQSNDLGQLFLGLSGLLIVSALILLALVLGLTLQSRAPQVGMLLAVGLSPRRVRLLMLAEIMFPLAGGVLLGVVAGLGFAQGLLGALGSSWSGAVASTPLEFRCTVASMVIAALAATAMSAGVVAAVLWRQFRRPARELLAGEVETARGYERPAGDSSRDFRCPACGRGPGAFFARLLRRGKPARCPGQLGWRLAISVSAAAVIGLTIVAVVSPGPIVWFLVGLAVLVAALITAWRLLLHRRDPSGLSNLPQLAWRNACRRPRASFAVLTLLASATFLVLAVGAYRQSPPADWARRDSGTGGFALVGQSTLPILGDLAGPRGPIKDLGVVPFRVRDGEDASCLNLNRPRRPRLLAVDPADLANRHAFAFNKVQGGAGWGALDASGADAVHGIADENTIRWSLHASLGDTIAYTDEQGRPMLVRLVGELAGSILQGSVIIGRRAFDEHFPSAGGYRFFLLDVPADRVQDVRAELTARRNEQGLALTPTADRLADLQSVENSYLAIFQVLGGLALLLGSAGLGLVVARNVLERRGELATMLAVGFTPTRLLSLVLLEHLALLCMGLTIGVIAAVPALAPAALGHHALPTGHLVTLMLAVAVTGVASTILAALLALHGPLVNSLRNE